MPRIYLSLTLIAVLAAGCGDGTTKPPSMPSSMDKGTPSASAARPLGTPHPKEMRVDLAREASTAIRAAIDRAETLFVDDHSTWEQFHKALVDAIDLTWQHIRAEKAEYAPSAWGIYGYSILRLCERSSDHEAALHWWKNAGPISEATHDWVGVADHAVCEANVAIEMKGNEDTGRAATMSKSAHRRMQLVLDQVKGPMIRARVLRARASLRADVDRDDAGAVTDWTESFAIDRMREMPEYADAAERLGACLCRTGRAADAVTQLAAIRKTLVENNENAWWLDRALGRTLAKIGDARASEFLATARTGAKEQGIFDDDVAALATEIAHAELLGKSAPAIGNARWLAPSDKAPDLAGRPYMIEVWATW
jgi:hypothetical protein